MRVDRLISPIVQRLRSVVCSGTDYIVIDFVPMLFHSNERYCVQGPDDPKPTYTFELTTNYFAIDPSGVLVVNEENLDRDPPSPGVFRFQVVAREKTGVAASSPLSFVVTLNDVNDNAPQLPMMAPVTVQAGETKRQIAKVRFFLLFRLFQLCNTVALASFETDIINANISLPLNRCLFFSRYISETRSAGVSEFETGIN